MSRPLEISVLLHNIRSAHNVGSMFRTAEAVGVSHIFITGYTPRPIDRFGRPDKEIAKTALGAEKSISWSSSKNPQTLIKKFKKENGILVGLEQDPRAVDYRTWQSQKGSRILFVVGNEVRGMSLGLRKEMDVLLEIPMAGKKESLNVSVAFGIGLFQIISKK